MGISVLGRTSIGDFYTGTGVGTDVAEGKKLKTSTENYVLETDIAELSSINACKVGTTGNLPSTKLLALQSASHRPQQNLYYRVEDAK